MNANDDVLFYTVQVHEDELGVWMKAPEFDRQLLAGDVEVGLELLDEHLVFELKRREKRGEQVPRKIVPKVKRVGKHEYGPTQVELEEQWVHAERAEELGG